MASQPGSTTIRCVNLDNILLTGSNVKITRLSYGIPMGVEIDYLDSITLERALKDRKDI